MPKLTSQQLREAYLKLPEDLKNAIFNIDSTHTIQLIGKKYDLNIDKIGTLADETGLIMLGLSKPKEFVDNLASRLGVDIGTANKIASDVNSQIFLKVRESLKKLHGGEEITSASSTPGVGGETPGVFPAGEVKREDILKVLEHPELPAVLAGTNKPEETQNLFEVKTKEEAPRAPMEETKHDPYREPII